MHNESSGSSKGFTLLELLIVLGIIGIIAGAVLVAVDPVKRIQEARDARRSSEVNALLNAVLNKQVDDRALYNGDTGALIVTSDTYAQVIVRDETGVTCNSAATRPGCKKTLNISAANTACVAQLAALAPTYIAEVPVDPSGSGTPCVTGSGCTTVGDLALSTSSASNNTGYYIQRSTGNRIEIGACSPEQAATIFVKR